jgi:hypothetical protein
VYKKKKEVEVANLSLPWWVVLNPDHAPKIDSIDMLHGTQVGFFGPTNIENIVGAPKHQYCCREEEKVHWPEFASKDPNRPTSDRGRLSMAAWDLGWEIHSEFRGNFAMNPIPDLLNFGISSDFFFSDCKMRSHQFRTRFLRFGILSCH